MTKTDQWRIARGGRIVLQKPCLACEDGVVLVFAGQDAERRKFCSKECRDIGNAHKRAEQRKAGTFKSRKGKRYKPRERRKCEAEGCSNLFEVIPTNKDQANRRFCSVSCANRTVLAGHFIGENSPRWAGRIKVQCANPECGREFECRVAEGRKTCSKECADKLFERRVILTCQNPSCRKQYEARARLAQKQKYCSRSCLFEAMPTSNTSIEKKVANLLKDVPGVRHSFQFQRFVIDFAIPDKKLFIECDGTYWHSTPEAVERDSIKDRLAAEQGWLMLRLSEEEINKDLEGCRKKIEQAIQSRAVAQEERVVYLDLTNWLHPSPQTLSIGS